MAIKFSINNSLFLLHKEINFCIETRKFEKNYLFHEENKWKSFTNKEMDLVKKNNVKLIKKDKKYKNRDKLKQKIFAKFSLFINIILKDIK